MPRPPRRKDDNRVTACLNELTRPGASVRPVLMRHLTLALILVIVSGSLGLAACGEDDETGAAPAAAAADPPVNPTPTATGTATGPEASGPAKSIVAAELDEWSIKRKPASVSAGSIEFETENVGTDEHELEVVKTDTAPDAFPVKDSKADVEAVGEEMGEVEDVEAGQTKEFVVNLEAGKYVLICNLPLHYEKGMTVGFTVE